MFIKAKEIQLKNGQKATLRSPMPSDAEALLEHLRRTSEETHFMSRYPEEILLTREEEGQFLGTIGQDADNFMISAYMAGKLVGNISVHRIQDLLKYRHRGGLGISIRRSAWNVGLGTALLREALEAAEHTEFEQIELGVFSDNLRALHLYERAGFLEVGRIPGAFRLKDGTYCDEIQMVYKIEKKKNEMRAMEKNEKWLRWAVELQSIAQAGLYYGKDKFDMERYARIRDIAAEMICFKSDIPQEKVKDLFCCETGYQTPKLDTRAAIFKNDKILLVQESNGTWSLPGGWVDVDLSVKENTIKEVKEEAGLDVSADRIIAVQDREKHNLPVYAYKVCKIFVLCSVLGGSFAQNIETVKSQYFGITELPSLATEKNNEEQIKMCFDAYYSKDWKPLFD